MNDRIVYLPAIASEESQMNLSFKDIQFIIEAIDRLMETYQERLNNIEDIDEDEASDLGNDSMFLAALRTDLAKSLEQGVSPQTKDSSLTNLEGLSLPELMQPVLQLLIKERLVLIDAITESIRNELSLSKL
ncbi:hypothetical protein [Microseira sp. BLCC-F43]|uniref:hypothetical protein n=1 Tax=Microseira sp. BLCC-F43 TaxID=3153602 RepID=UPI0035B8C30D